MAGVRSAGQYPVESWGADVDWVTQVYTDHNQAERALWRAENWVEEERARGNKVQSWGLAGFNGKAAGGIFYGRRGREGLVQATSTQAARSFGVLAEIGGHTSRIDLALTATLSAGRCSPAKEAVRTTRAATGRGRRASWWRLITGSDGGATYYLGSPTSEQRLRIYDKGAEDGSAAPMQKWRWEMQLRRKRAQRYSIELASAPTRDSAVGSMVLGWLQHLSLRSPSIALERANILAVEGSTDAHNTLQWLTMGVAPSVARLLEFYPRATILEALGLQEPARGNGPPHRANRGNDGDW